MEGQSAHGGIGAPRIPRLARLTRQVLLHLLQAKGRSPEELEKIAGELAKKKFVLDTAAIIEIDAKRRVCYASPAPLPVPPPAPDPESRRPRLKSTGIYKSATPSPS